MSFVVFKNDLFSDFTHLILNIKFELRKHLKRKRLYLVVALAILLPLIFYVIPPAFGIEFAETAATFANSNLGFINLLIVISGAVFVGDAVSGEFENKTGLMLFPTPQRRTPIFVGKFIAAVIGVWLVVSLYYLVTVLEIVQIYGIAGISTEITQSFLLALLYSISVVSIIFFFSSILKRTITSALIGFFLLMMILPIISGVLIWVDVDPWFIVTYSAGLITGILGLPVEMHGPQAVDTVAFQPEFYTGVAVMVAYSIIFFILATIIANRRKME
jgi:ABC-2 type transport system permease protein